MDDDELAVFKSLGGKVIDPLVDISQSPVFRQLEQAREELWNNAVLFGNVQRMLQIPRNEVEELVMGKELYGLNRGGLMRFPQWQFNEREIIPGAKLVIENLRDEADPVALDQFMYRHHTDLDKFGDDGNVLHQFSPRDWLLKEYRTAGEAQQGLLADLVREL